MRLALPVVVVRTADERDDLLDTVLGLLAVFALRVALRGTVLSGAGQSDAGGASVLFPGVADLLLRPADDLPVVLLADFVDALSPGHRGGSLHGVSNHGVPPGHPAHAVALASSRACDELPARLLADLCNEL